jgi:hypothetical protein
MSGKARKRRRHPEASFEVISFPNPTENTHSSSTTVPKTVNVVSWNVETEGVSTTNSLAFASLEPQIVPDNCVPTDSDANDVQVDTFQDFDILPDPSTALPSQRKRTQGVSKFIHLSEP